MWHFQNSQIKNYEIKINDQKRRTNVTFVEGIKMKCGNMLYIYIDISSTRRECSREPNEFFRNPPRPFRQDVVTSDVNIRS